MIQEGTQALQGEVTKCEKAIDDLKEKNRALTKQLLAANRAAGHKCPNVGTLFLDVETYEKWRAMIYQKMEVDGPKIGDGVAKVQYIFYRLRHPEQTACAQIAFNNPDTRANARALMDFLDARFWPYKP